MMQIAHATLCLRVSLEELRAYFANDPIRPLHKKALFLVQNVTTPISASILVNFNNTKCNLMNLLVQNGTKPLSTKGTVILCKYQ